MMIENIHFSFKFGFGFWCFIYIINNNIDLNFLFKKEMGIILVNKYIFQYMQQ